MASTALISGRARNREIAMDFPTLVVSMTINDLAREFSMTVQVLSSMKVCGIIIDPICPNLMVEQLIIIPGCLTFPTIPSMNQNHSFSTPSFIH